jgi:hypothetical protein
VIGLGLLGEHLRGGASGVVFGLFGAGLAAWGVVLLSRAAEGTSTGPAEAPGEPDPSPAAVHALVPATTGTSGFARWTPSSVAEPYAPGPVVLPSARAQDGTGLHPIRRPPGRRRRRHRCPGRRAGERRAA